MRKQSVIKKIRIYPSILYFRREKWLTKMSLQGWHLVNRRFGIIYYFEKGLPKEKEYFAWEATYTGEGKYSIPMRYPFLKKTYGVKKQKSKLNKNAVTKHVTIIEIDTDRIDIYNDLAYQELKKDRNHLYLLRFLKNFVIFVILLITWILVAFWV